MNLGMKRVAYLRNVAREFDHRSAWPNFNVHESLRGQPLRHRLNVRIGGAKLLAELLGSQPGVIVRGRLALLLIEDLPERGFLIRASLQEQQYSL